MKIIGHRGVSGLALENTLPSLELARLLGVDAIEFDVRKTKDGALVLCHDSDLDRISSLSTKVSELTLNELQQVTLNDGQSMVPTLEQALKMTLKTPVVIELKESECVEKLLEILKKFPDIDITVASFKLNELTKLRNLAPHLKLVGLERTKPFEIIQSARARKLNGVGMNYWLLNPFTYWLIKRRKLSVYVFTVNNRFIGKFLSFFYPQAAICTNHPEWFIKHPWLRLRRGGRALKTRQPKRFM